MRICLGLICLFLFGNAFSQNHDSNQFDSIFKLRALSFDDNLSDSLRVVYAKKAIELSRKTSQDSTVLKSGRSLGILYDVLGQTDLWQQQNIRNLRLAYKLSDTLALAVANFNIGIAKQHYDVQYDSAFFYYRGALKYYDELGNTELVATLYSSIAHIQVKEKVYISSEENAIKALRLFNTLPKTESILDDIWIINNLLGLISAHLGRYTEALEYHSKAIDIANEMRNGEYNKTNSFHNQANVYIKLQNYEKAIELFNELIELRPVYEVEDPAFYPLIIDNLAYTKILAGHKDYDKISNMFYEAYEISTDLDYDIVKLAVTIDLSKFYKHLKVKDSTLKYAVKAYDLAKKISSTDILLESMVLLSELKEGEEGKRYLRDHIKLTDSLLYVERNVGNKFARIELETDQLVAENKQISKENLYLLILSIGLLVTAILVYILISQRAKNRKLKLIQVQQKANEDIYNLMLGQQDKVDEARAKEKTRVSKELHDGVLGGLFGVRLSLDSINFNEGKEAMMTRAKYISQLKTIEHDIRKISHELNTDFISGSSFIDIVTELIENQTQAYNLEHEFDYTDDIHWELVANKIKINIYRIIQESMQNIYKHANAKVISVCISLEKDLICLDIVDDGSGFDTSKSKKGIGLKNMSSRVSDINGTINFTSQSGTGTTVNVKIPYTN
ncbi:tetratricopeptide repeat-containing sensor histidine kinase [Winogradskyella thalassocola]|uniref:histidine kinase n=1 Tax=Winogradskyella thalassocola TaxID=262004 RepID=A0A1G7Y1F6_9FLAO|nr:tetratricopeptide repeat-containing sensor histidine kinase [Winogradskyella thalassocola]SDG90298.1 Histidine kinase-, DNA gyrase B-, and HSP90-like ATPase [Winogradskyella thalassocola]